MNKDEKVETVEKERVTLGFSVSGAPIWLCKELEREAKKHYANIYWPVIVEWHRKAKEFDNMVRNGMPGPETGSIPKVEEQVEKVEDDYVPLMGGHKGGKLR